jgi:hypothetical protein
VIPNKRRAILSGKYTAVFGIYPVHAGVEKGVDALRLAGFRHADISVLYPENTVSGDLAEEESNKGQDGASVVRGTGALVGGVVGWLVGMVGRPLLGADPFLAVGPILATLVGAGLGGVVGEIGVALAGMGRTEGEAPRYEAPAMRSGIPLFVHPHSSESAKRAREILEQTGARYISSIGEVHPASASDRPPVREVA